MESFPIGAGEAGQEQYQLSCVVVAGFVSCSMKPSDVLITKTSSPLDAPPVREVKKIFNPSGVGIGAQSSVDPRPGIVFVTADPSASARRISPCPSSLLLLK